MIEAKFSPDMRAIIKSMKGRILKSYEGVPEFQKLPVEFYGNLRINLGRESVDFTNFVKTTEFAGTIEDVSCFACEKAEKNSEFQPYLAGPHLVYMVNERIKSVAIVVDRVFVPDEDYEIEFDMALVVRTTHNVYTFTRGWYYWESIEVFVDKDKEMPYPVEQAQGDWDNIQNGVTITRRIEEL